MNTTMPLRFTRDELLAALEAKRPETRKEDAARMRQHRAAEKAALALFRTTLRDALKWDYATVRHNRFDVTNALATRAGSRYSFTAPTCPLSAERDLDRFLATIRQTTQQTFTISLGGQWDSLHRFLVSIPDADLCD